VVGNVNIQLGPWLECTKRINILLQWSLNLNQLFLNQLNVAYLSISTPVLTIEHYEIEVLKICGTEKKKITQKCCFNRIIQCF